MTITLSPDIEQAIAEQARRQGITPESLVLQALREKFAPSGLVPSVLEETQGDWERSLLAAGSDCGVSLPHEALSSEGLYD
jgi:hypothetical protein